MTASKISPVLHTFNELKASQARRALMPLARRKEALAKLEAAILSNEEKLFAALKKDLGRSSFETFITEIALIKSELKLALGSLSSWTRARRVSTPIVFQPGTSYIEPMPKGVVLIISPWNYPLQLSLLPLISAIAAGNCAIVKPSELAPASEQVLLHLINDHLDSSCFRVIPGGADTAQALLKLPFDHIFYTGGAQVARDVLRHAAENLIPTTLELGGKSPVIIDQHCNLKLAVKRIWWAKCLNAGQTCVAPDYVLMPKTLQNDFVALSKEYIFANYGLEIEESASFGRIVNERHLKRLVGYLEDGEIAFGGRYKTADLFIEPALLLNVPVDASALNEEIFGPILPIVSVDSLDEAIAFVAQRPHPLALYIFSDNKESINKVKDRTSSGGLCINECISQAGILGLPFGGIGPSGMGNYHGKFGFETFSHLRAVHQRANLLDNPLKYPPYSDQKLNLARLVM